MSNKWVKSKRGNLRKKIDNSYNSKMREGQVPEFQNPRRRLLVQRRNLTVWQLTTNPLVKNSIKAMRRRRLRQCRTNRQNLFLCNVLLFFFVAEPHFCPYKCGYRLKGFKDFPPNVKEPNKGTP